MKTLTVRMERFDLPARIQQECFWCGQRASRVLDLLLAMGEHAEQTIAREYYCSRCWDRLFEEAEGGEEG